MSDEADGYHSAHYVKTSEDAAAVGINAGLDQEGGGNGQYYYDSYDSYE